MSECIDYVALRMRSNRLQLNTGKTEVPWCASSRRQHQVPPDPVRCRGRFRLAGQHSMESGDLPRLRHLDEKSHVELFCRPATDPQYPLICHKAVFAVTGEVTRLARLRQRDAAWSANIYSTGTHLVHSARNFDHVTLLLQDLH